MLDDLLDQRDFPCGTLPATYQQMCRAEPCRRCRGTDLIPVSDCDSPPTLAIACEDCGEKGGQRRRGPAQPLPEWTVRELAQCPYDEPAAAHRASDLQALAETDRQIAIIERMAQLAK
jgi:hypothetical protein